MLDLVLLAYYFEYVVMATGQNYTKIHFIEITSNHNTTMDVNDKRSLSYLGSPSRDDVLRCGAKYARAFKSLLTIPI